MSASVQEAQRHTSRLWFLRRPLILLAVVLLGVGALVGVAAAGEALVTRQDDARFDAWVREADAARDANLPILEDRLAAVHFPADIQQAGSPKLFPGDHAALFGPWSTERSPKTTRVAVAKALERGGFTDVTTVGNYEGWKVTATSPNGEVWVYVNPSGNGSRLLGVLKPPVPPCC